MISLKRIIEQQGATGQYYDLGRDYANFKRAIDGNSDQIKQKFEQAIGERLNGKRIHARASRGYKQYVKDYEFDVSKITLDDYYDNYVVIAHDNSTPKPKEYFLKPGFKIQIVGPATGQPSPQKGHNPNTKVENPISPENNPDTAQSQPMSHAPVSNIPTKELPLKEAGGTGHYDAYSIDAITQDIKLWLPNFLIKPETTPRDFIKGIGWMKNLGNGKSVALFDLKIPANTLKPGLTKDSLAAALFKLTQNGTISTRYDLVKMESNDTKDEWAIRIKKTMTDTTI